jgi:uncharacterized protein with HEPN domain
VTGDDRLNRWWRDPKVRQTLEDVVDFAAMAADLVGRGFEPFMADRILQVAGETVITRIGEAANRLPDAFRAEFADVPWRGVIGMRNRLVHHYEATDPEQVWAALERSIPEFVAKLGLT